MPVKHTKTFGIADKDDASVLRPSDWHANHGDTREVTYYGADPTGVDDSSEAFQQCLDIEGRARVPRGTYRLDTPIVLKASGDGIIGEGSKVVTLSCATGVVTVDPSQSAAIDSCHLSGFYAVPQTTTTTGHSNSQDYYDGTALDLTGIQFSVVRDIYTFKWQKHLVLGYSAYLTYKNRIDGFRCWGGEVGIEVGGTATAGAGSTHDGANANVFVGCSVMAAQVMIVVQGGYNSFVGTRIENPLQSAGYPATSTGIRMDSGLYAIYNQFTDTYCELVGTGNKSIHAYYTGETGYISPNSFDGGSFVVGTTLTYPTFDTELASSAVGFHLDASGMRSRHRLTEIGGTLATSRYYDAVGGEYTQKYVEGTGAVTITTETYGTAAPSTGSWIRGARCWNTEPSAEGVMGWVCVTAGSPGTWKSFGTIEA